MMYEVMRFMLFVWVRVILCREDTGTVDVLASISATEFTAAHIKALSKQMQVRTRAAFRG